MQTQSSQIETTIKEEFKKLHQFLAEEESKRLRVLKLEEETKTELMSKKIQTLQEHIQYLFSTITHIDKVLLEKDLPFLKVETALQFHKKLFLS